ncbi:hypothetical protein J0S82_015073, partial [Galemys pyrenaicus]
MCGEKGDPAGEQEKCNESEASLSTHQHESAQLGENPVEYNRCECGETSEISFQNRYQRTLSTETCFGSKDCVKIFLADCPHLYLQSQNRSEEFIPVNVSGVGRRSPVSQPPVTTAEWTLGEALLAKFPPGNQTSIHILDVTLHINYECQKYRKLSPGSQASLDIREFSHATNPMNVK